MALRPNLARGLDHDGDDPDRRPVLADDRRIVEIHPDLLRLAGTPQRQLLIRIGQCAARQADLHDVVVEVGDLRPAVAHGGSEQFAVAAGGEV
jgi:hypothetical protein